MDKKKKSQQDGQPEDKDQVKKSLFIYLMVFLGSVIVLIGLAYLFQLKDNRETKDLLQDQMASIENNQTLIQNKQIENTKLKEDIASLETELASSENEYKVLEASSELLENKNIHNERLLTAYRLYIQNEKTEAKAVLSEVSPEFVNKEVFDAINNKLNK